MEFETFVRSELAGLAKFAGALTGDRHEAEDMLAEALLRVCDRWHEISRLDSPAAYVRRVIVTTYISDRRKVRRRRTAPSSDPSVLDRAEPDRAAQVIDRDEVDRLLRRLPRQQKAAMVLRYLLDSTDEEIAEALGCSTGTVRSHLSIARATLRLAVKTSATKDKA